MREFQGTHPSGGGSLKSGYNEGKDRDMDLEPPTFGDKEELDDNKTMAPAAKDDKTSCFTRRPTSNKHVAFAEIDDFSDYKSLRTLKPPEQPRGSRHHRWHSRQ